jgi:MFS family permease
LAIGVFGLRAFGQSGMSLTSTVLVARSIDVRRGAALGWLAALAGFAITLTPLVASRVIPVVGWRQTWLLLAATVLVGSYLLAAVTGRFNLDRNGSDEPESEPAATEPSLITDVVATERQRRWALAVVTMAVATTGGVVTALAFHQIALLGERGLSATAAATNFLPQSLAAATCAILVGRAVDRLPGRLVLASVMGVLVLALASLWLVDSPLTAVLFGLLLGSGVASNHASEGALLVRWTGTVGLGARRGRMMAIAVAATAVAPLAFTLLADLIGSFTRAASVLIALPIAVAIAALLAPLAEPRLWARPEPSPVLESVTQHDET